MIREVEGWMKEIREALKEALKDLCEGTCGVHLEPETLEMDTQTLFDAIKPVIRDYIEHPRLY